MPLSDLTESYIIVGALSIASSLTRILLNVDKDIPMYKQFLLIVTWAMPVGLLTYHTIYQIGLEYPEYMLTYAAWPISLFASLFAISAARILIKDGPKALFMVLIGRTK